jgi:hypothetical protein
MPDDANCRNGLGPDSDIGHLRAATPTSSTHSYDSTPIDDITVQRAHLRALEADPVRFMQLGLPMKASLWLALTRTSNELAARRGDGNIPAIVAIGEAIVRRAVVGDLPAVAMIADRIEGRTVERAGDVEPEQESRRVETAAMIESIVEALTRTKLEEREESIISPAVPATE